MDDARIAVELPADITADEGKKQLEQLIANPLLRATRRGRNILAYIVAETLAGRSDRIKAYSIATQILGRSDSFDPQSDPIVRVEVGSLRRALTEYYEGPGRSDPIAISIPKGRYAASFARQSVGKSASAAASVAEAMSVSPLSEKRPDARLGALAAVAATVVAASLAAILIFGLRGSPQPTSPATPRILVVPFEDNSATPNAVVARGLVHEIYSKLVKFRDIIVVEAEDQTYLESDPKGTYKGGNDPRFALLGNVQIDNNVLHLQTRLVDRTDGTIAWANSYDSPLGVSDMVAIESDIASQVATAIAQPYGIVFQADVNRPVSNPPDDWKAYSCTLAYYQYRATLDAKTYPDIRQCLEDTVARFPSYSNAWALLSQSYVDEIRFRFSPGPGVKAATLDDSLAAARRAINSDPQNARGLQAEMLALYFKGSMADALAVGDKALALNPNDTELMGELGYRLSLSGDWQRGCKLVTEARNRNPGPLGYYETALALCSYFAGDYPQAVKWIESSKMTGNPNYHFIAAAVMAEAGRHEDAVAEGNWLKTNAPAVVPKLRAEVTKRLGRPADVERFMASLKKAGLPAD